MSRLIDADALLEVLESTRYGHIQRLKDLITNAPTVQREGFNVDEMVNRFLGWKLPKDFTPDCGIEFDRNKYANNEFNPIGTNLFTAPQAKAMIEYMISAAPKE